MRLHIALLAASGFLLTASVAFASPEVPGAEQSRPVALVGATVHPVAQPEIPNGIVVFEDGRITAVGSDVDVPEGAVVLDLSGKHVYPGMFDAMTNLGLIEIDSVRATRDQSETGTINPNVRAAVAVNPDSELIPVTRSNGVLLALTAPVGGLIAGRSAIIQLDGWTWEDMTLQDDVGMHLHWPNMEPVTAWYSEESSAQQRRSRDDALERLRDVFEDARAYQRAREERGEAQPRDLRWEAMLSVLAGEQPVIIEANEVQEIQAAVAFAQQEDLRLIIYGGYDAPQCAELLKKHDVPVIVGSVYRLPLRRSDPYDAPFTVPERLRQAGVKYCISGGGKFSASNVRNLPYHAAQAAAFGLPLDEALKSVTLFPAQILGVSDRVGSIEGGKDATLIVTDGDPLETATHVEAAFIRGREVDLSDRHKRLWKKYEEKYRRQSVPTSEAAE